MEQLRRAHLFRDALYHRWRVVAIVLLLGCLAGLLLAMQRPVVYASTASILVNPLVGNPYTTEGQGDDLVNLQSESQLVTSDDVTSVVAQDLSIAEDSPLLARGVTAVARQNTQIIDLTVSGTDPENVQAVAEKLSEVYLENRGTLARESVDAQAGVLQERIDETQARLSTAQNLANTGPTDERNLQARLADSYEADLFTLRAQLIQVESTPVGPGQVISISPEASAQSGLVRLLILAVGVLGGLMLGLLLAVARERSKDLVRGVDELGQLELPVLAAYTSRAADHRSEMTSRLRMEVLGRFDTPLNLVIAPCSPHGSHQLPIALARSVADLGFACVLVDADGDALPGDSGLPHFAAGLSDVMLDNRRAIDLLMHFGHGLHFLPPGEQLPLARDLFLTSRLAQQMDELRDLGHLTVVVQAPNLSDIAGEALSSVADGLIMVVTLHRTTLREVQAAKNLLQARGVTVLGVVVVLPDASLAPASVLRGDVEAPVDDDVVTSFPVKARDQKRSFR